MSAEKWHQHVCDYDAGSHTAGNTQSLGERLEGMKARHDIIVQTLSGVLPSAHLVLRSCSMVFWRTECRLGPQQPGPLGRAHHALID